MALSYVTYPADGVTNQFDITFGYLSRSHVFVFVDDELRSFKWITGTRVELNLTPLAGQEVRINRLTDRVTRISEFSDGQTLLAEDLNAGDLQNFYILQEVADQIADGVLTGAVPINDAGFGYVTEQWIAAQLEANIAGSEALGLLQQSIADEAAARVAAISAEATQRANDILAEAQARATAVGALDTRIESLETTVDDPTTGLTTRTGSLEGRMTAVESGKASVTAVDAINAQINDPGGLQATSDAYNLRITTVENDKAEASALNAVTARVDDVEASAQVLTDAFVDAQGNALASVRLVAAASGGNPAQIELLSGDGSQIRLTGNTLIEGNLLVDGTIVGEKVAAGTLTAANFSTNMGNFTGAIRVGAAGSSTDVAYMAGSNVSTTHRIWAGNDNPNNAPFQVMADGSLVASKLNIVTENGDLVFSSSTGFSDYGKNLLLINTGNFVNPVVTSLADDNDTFALTYLQTTDVQHRVTIPVMSETIHYYNNDPVPPTNIPSTITVTVRQSVDGGAETVAVTQALQEGVHYTIESTIIPFGELPYDKSVVYTARGKAPYDNEYGAIVFPDETNAANAWQSTITVGTGASKVVTYRTTKSYTGDTNGRSLSIRDINPGQGFLVDDTGASAPGNLQDADLLNGQNGAHYKDRQNHTGIPEFAHGDTFDPDGGGTGSDTATDVAFAMKTSGRFVGTHDGYIRTLMAWTASSDIEIGQGGTSLIGGINLLPGSSGTAKYRGEEIATRNWVTAQGYGSGGGSDPMRLSNGSAAAPAYSFSSNTDTGMFLAGDGLYLSYNNPSANQFRIDGDGVVFGEGATGSNTGAIGMTVNDGYGNANFVVNHYKGVPDQAGSAYRIECAADGSTAVMSFELKNSVTAGVATALNEIMQLRQDYVQLGNSSHDVGLNMHVTSAQGLKFYSSGSWIGEITCTDTTWLRINQGIAKNIYTPRYIRADGGFFVDGATYGISNVGRCYAHPGSVTSPGITFGNDLNTGIYRHGTDSIGFATGGVQRGYWNGNSLYANEVSLTSDIRVKSNIKDIPYGLSTVLQLSPKWYTRDDMGGKPEIGLISQDVKKIVPELVPPVEGDELLGVLYPKAVPLLIKAIQELSEKNDNLEARLERMETIIGKLST